MIKFLGMFLVLAGVISILNIFAAPEAVASTSLRLQVDGASSLPIAPLMGTAFILLGAGLCHKSGWDVDS